MQSASSNHFARVTYAIATPFILNSSFGLYSTCNVQMLLFLFTTKSTVLYTIISGYLPRCATAPFLLHFYFAALALIW